MMKKCTCTSTPVVFDCGCEKQIFTSPFPLGDGICVTPDPCAVTESVLGDCVPGDPSENFPNYLRSSATFNMPACGQTGEIYTSKASRFSAGTVLFNSGVGRLLITAVPDDTKVVVKNECSACNVRAPGETIAAGTVFALGIPECGASVGAGAPSPTQPYLDSDFVIPAIGEPGVVAKATNISGLSINDMISISSLDYKIAAIIDSTTIRFVNMGNGGVVNTLVESDEDGDGIPNFPIIRIGGQNPCAIAPVSSLDRLIGCDAGNQFGFVGDVTNQVPSWDNETKKWVLKVVNDLALCVTTASCCLILDPDNDPDHTYLVDVNPGTAQIQDELNKVFPNSLGAILGGDVFCITQVVDANTIRVRPGFVVAEITTYDEGTAICVQECCEQCRPVVETPARSGLGFGSPEEVLIAIAPTTWSAPAGTSVHTLPVGLENVEGNQIADGHLWDHHYTNEGGCGCRKYFEIESNFEFAVLLATGLFANVEYRMVKIAPVADSFLGAAMPFVSVRPLLSALDDSFNLLRGGNPGTFNTVNTWKGSITDRDFILPGVQNRYYGHVRVVVENTTGGALDISLAGAMRTWYRVSAYKDGTL